VFREIIAVLAVHVADWTARFKHDVEGRRIYGYRQIINLYLIQSRNWIVPIKIGYLCNEVK
jgi:hypothetical protein